MNVFITHSYFYQLDPKQWRNCTPYPPLATITALAVLRETPHTITFYDPALDPTTEKCIRTMENAQPEVVVIYEDGFNYLTKMCLTVMREACFKLIEAAKKMGATVIVSSSDATDHFDLYHAHGADIVLHGEGEASLKECMAVLEKGSLPDEVTGISFQSGNEVIKNAPRGNSRELDAIPDAAWEVIDIEAYRAIWKQGKFPFTLNISTTRGCPFKCNWCAKPIYGNRYNSRSPERVAEELAMLSNRYGVRHFWITDDIFGLKPGWVKHFRDLIREKQLDIRYKIQSRADLLLTDSTIDELAESGLEEVWIGAESGSQKILDAMDKGITVEQIAQSTRLLQQKGVRVAYFLQFGYLGETREDIQKTVKMVRTNRPDDIGISVSYPLPGTKFYERVKEELGKKSNWTDSDDLDLMFKGTFQSAFYKRLQRYVHHIFRAQQGWQKIRKPSAQISWRYAVLLPYNMLSATYLKRTAGK